MALRKRDARAVEYRRLAIAADALAAASLLAHVREKHEHAAARWIALAVLDEQPIQPALSQPRGRRPGKVVASFVSCGPAGPDQAA
ncbi:MAG: hypothetical protein JF588_06200 [Caulobacterales bacterium]|nr:hypothetical protein [Caulobacterales bacterium]